MVHAKSMEEWSWILKHYHGTVHNLMCAHISRQVKSPTSCKYTYKGDLLKSVVVVDEVSNSQQDEGSCDSPQQGQPLRQIIFFFLYHSIFLQDFILIHV